MRYPTLAEENAVRDLTDVFLGYNHNLRIGKGELYDMLNLTSDAYPTLSPRAKRGLYTLPEGDALPALIAKDGLCYTDGRFLVLDGERIDMGLSDEKKTLVSMGAYVLILPDKKYLNTADPSDRGDIEARFVSEGEVSFQLCALDGSDYTDATLSPTAPEEPADLDLWIDTSSTPHVLNRYSAASAMWVAVITTYIRISARGIGRLFNIEDGVKIEGVTVSGLEALNATHIIWDKGDDYITVTGITDAALTQTDSIRVSRLMPDMDFVTESGNRLWGCRYGLSADGKPVNEIYASKQGDFKNWNCFMGVSTDSYAATVGTDGAFTGAVTHLGYPLFFKENHLHKVHGTHPASYQIQTISCRGVERGCGGSLATVNEALFYKSPSGVCVYDGSLPIEIGSALGDVRYGNALAAAHRGKYYLSMQELDSGEYLLFVYDTRLGLWHKEEGINATSFASHDGELYYVDGLDGGIKTLFGGGVRDESPVKWMAETGPLGVDSPDKKYLSRILIRLRLEVGARVRVWVKYDADPHWEPVHTITGKSLGSFSLPIRPRRCDHLRLRIEGEGEATLYSICKTVEEGSDV